MDGFRKIEKDMLYRMMHTEGAPAVTRVWFYAKLHEHNPGDGISMNTFDVSRETGIGREHVRVAILRLVKVGWFRVIKTVGRGVKIVMLTAPETLAVPPPKTGSTRRTEGKE